MAILKKNLRCYFVLCQPCIIFAVGNCLNGNTHFMEPYTLIDKYYPENNELKHILLVHSRSVTDKCLEIANAHPELAIDVAFVREAAMLHDIGIFRTKAPGIQCFGTEPYIRHGLIGAELLRAEGFPRHALVCERHTGAGITIRNIKLQGLPLPERDFIPESIEEQLICYADKFFSKTHLNYERTPERAFESLEKFGPAGLSRFTKWMKMFQ